MEISAKLRKIWQAVKRTAAREADASESAMSHRYHRSQRLRRFLRLRWVRYVIIWMWAFLLIAVFLIVFLPRLAYGASDSEGEQTVRPWSRDKPLTDPCMFGVLCYKGTHPFSMGQGIRFDLSPA